MSGQSLNSPVDEILRHVDVAGIQDERARECIGLLLNLIESLTADLRKAQAENLYLREQLNRRKGGGDKSGQAKEDPAGAKSQSSEKERAETKLRTRRAVSRDLCKRFSLIGCPVRLSSLPPKSDRLRSGGYTRGRQPSLWGEPAASMRASVFCWRAACLRRGGNPPAPACPRRGKRERGRSNSLLSQWACGPRIVMKIRATPRSIL